MTELLGLGEYLVYLGACSVLLDWAGRFVIWVFYLTEVIRLRMEEEE